MAPSSAWRHRHSRLSVISAAIIVSVINAVIDLPPSSSDLLRRSPRRTPHLFSFRAAIILLFPCALWQFFAPLSPLGTPRFTLASRHLLLAPLGTTPRVSRHLSHLSASPSRFSRLSASPSRFSRFSASPSRFSRFSASPSRFSRLSASPSRFSRLSAPPSRSFAQSSDLWRYDAFN